MTDLFDVIIVGSGPAGSTYARTIKDAVPSASVLMVEAGPAVSTPPGRHVRTIPDPRERVAAQFASQGPYARPDDMDAAITRALSPGRGRTAEIAARPGTWLLEARSVDTEDGFPAAALSSNVGGMGAHWSGACPWPDQGEMSPDVDPLRFADALQAAKQVLRVTQHAFDGAPLGAEVREMLGSYYDAGRPQDRRVQPMPLAMDVTEGRRYWTAPDAILGDLLTATRFELRSETVARRILRRSGRADGLLLHDRREDRSYEVGARFIVVAADALRTPQLLAASDITPAALGHYLNEHTMVSTPLQLDPSLRPADDGAKKASDGALDVLAGVSWVPFWAPDFPLHGQITQWDASPIPIDPSLEVWPGSIVECSVFMGKADVRFEDHLEFDSDHLDYLGMPSIHVRYSLTDSDQQRLTQATFESERMAGLLGEPLNGSAATVMPHGASLHYQGTTRTGVDDQTSTLDDNMRVWGTDTVYVGGNGVIPTPAACNPTLTNVAFSIMGARDLAGRL